MIKISLLFLFLVLFLASCGDRNGITQSLEITQVTGEFKDAVKSGTAGEMFEAEERIVKSAEYGSELDDKISEYYNNPDRCPYGIGSWDWWWGCKDGKLIKRE